MGGCSKNQLRISYASLELRGTVCKNTFCPTHTFRKKANVPTLSYPSEKAAVPAKNIFHPPLALALFPELPAGQPGRHPAPEPPIRSPGLQAGGDPGGGGGRGQGVGGQGGGAAKVRQEIDRL